MNQQTAIRLKVPQQGLDQSSFFALEVPAVDEWIAKLPMTNLGQTTRDLYRAISELNQVRMLPPLRLAILERLRTPLHFASRALSKRYLNQPIVLPEQPRRISELAKALHQQLALGYTIVATHAAAIGSHDTIEHPEKLLAKALHRAITEYNINMIRHYQLYEPVDDGLWHRMHQFYLLARQHQVLGQEVNDPEFAASTVKISYVRALLMGCSKPNQLRQEDFMGMFVPLTSWAAHCPLTTDRRDSMFVVNLEGDAAPIYREIAGTNGIKQGLFLDTKDLAHYLAELREQDEPGGLRIGKDYKPSADLLGHLVVSLGSVSKRHFMRVENNDVLELCVGLSTAHHFICGGVSFESLLAKKGAATFNLQKENPFLKVQSQATRNKDIWDSPYTSNVGQTSVSLESIEFHIRENEQKTADATTATPKYRSHNVQVCNSSANGYCIEWPAEIAAQLKTGEIVGIKEAQHNQWSIAVIRWVSHRPNKQTQLGLELISPSASPYGARIVRKVGNEAEYVRVLVLPEISNIGQPVTLLTPRVPFKTGMKVVVNQRGKEVQVTLTGKVNQTGAYGQFTFRKVGATAALHTDSKGNDEGFDSLWNSL